jgi:hypothetical protein
MFMHRVIGFLIIATAVALPCSAGSITISATDSGRYLDTGTKNSDLPGIYGTGWFGGIPAEIRSFFSFNLSGVSGTVTAATLHLETQPSSSSYISNDPSETLTLFDVSTALASLVGGTAGVAGFNDLGSGTQYGNAVVLSSVGQFIDIQLSPGGLAYLNGILGGTAVFGGAITTLAKGASNEILFNGTSSSLTRQLLLTTDSAATPEPAAILLCGAGLLSLTMARRRMVR